MAPIDLSSEDGFDMAVCLGGGYGGIIQAKPEYPYLGDAVDFKIIVVGKFDQLKLKN